MPAIMREAAKGKKEGPLRPLSARALDGFRDDPLCEDAAEVRLVLDGPLEIRLHAHALGRLLRRGLDRGRVELLPLERRLDALGAHRLRARPGHADAGARAG